MLPTNTWIPSPGHPDAKAFLARYPSPRALRIAWQEEGGALLSPALQALPWKRDITLSAVVHAALFDLRDLDLVYSIIAEAAHDAEIWIASDGSKTVRRR